MTDRDSYLESSANVIRADMKTIRAIDAEGYVVVPKAWLSGLMRLHDELAEMTCIAPSVDACTMLDRLRVVIGAQP